MNVDQFDSFAHNRRSKRLKVRHDPQLEFERKDVSTVNNQASTTARNRRRPLRKLTRTLPYTSIDSEKGDIRLLELQPGRFQDILDIRLVASNLLHGAEQAYEALSYVWGTSICPQKAILNGIPVTITENLNGISITPDYTKSVRQVFMEAMVAMLRQNQLTIYLHAPLHPLREAHGIASPTSLPSWVPDFQISNAAFFRDLRGTDLPFSIDRAYHRPLTLLKFRLGLDNAPFNVDDKLNTLCRDLPWSTCRLSGNLSVLHVPGRKIGTIVATSGDLLNHMEKSNPLSGLPESLYKVYKSTIEPYEAEAVDLVAALVSLKEVVPWYRKYGNEVAEEPQNPTSTNKSGSLLYLWKGFAANIRSIAKNRLIFTTDSKRVGLSYHPDSINGIRPGDRVVGLFHINLIFILRKNHPDGTWQMINIASVVDERWRNTSEDADVEEYRIM